MLRLRRHPTLAPPAAPVPSCVSLGRRAGGTGPLLPTDPSGMVIWPFELMPRHDALIVFAEPRIRRSLDRLARGHHWPKLVHRDLPGRGRTHHPSRLDDMKAHHKRPGDADAHPGGPSIEITPSTDQYAQLCRDLSTLRRAGASTNTDAVLEAVRAAAARQPLHI